MAGAYWHFYSANRALEVLGDTLMRHKVHRCMLAHRSLFLAGVQGPDFNFYPGGDGEISRIAHGSQPADLGRALLEFAASDEEKAFAYGWLMHLTTDIITHPLVNRLILDYFPRQTRNGTRPELYPLGHHRVEWGIDVELLQNRTVIPYLPDTEKVLKPAREMDPLAGKALREIAQYTLPPEIWRGSIEGMIRFLAIFTKAWRLTGRLPDANPIKQRIKELGYYCLVNPLARLAALQNPENGAGVFIPIKPGEVDTQAVLDHSELVCSAFEGFLGNEFSELPNTTG